jgi:SEC-C motif
MKPASFTVDQIMAGLIRRNCEAKEVMVILDRAFAGVRRHDSCPCGSGRRFNRCHGVVPNKLAGMKITASVARSKINNDGSSVHVPGSPAASPISNRKSQS